jgi:hypothetical protein
VSYFSKIKLSKQFSETRSSREVSSYDFDQQDRSVSPDLGIPDHSQSYKNNDDDDGFGDFASARSNTQKSTTNNTDLFGDFSSPKNGQSSTRLPKPPSAPTSPVPKPANSHNIIEESLFDLTPEPNPPSNSNNAFDLFSSAPNVPTAPASIDLFGDFESAPKQSSTNNGLDKIFGDFGSAPVIQSNSNLSGWGDLIAPTPIQPKTVEQKAPEPKLDDGWSFLEKQLDGLTLKNTKKAAPSMNEMMRKN